MTNTNIITSIIAFVVVAYFIYAYTQRIFPFGNIPKNTKTTVKLSDKEITHRCKSGDYKKPKCSVKEDDGHCKTVDNTASTQGECISWGINAYKRKDPTDNSSCSKLNNDAQNKCIYFGPKYYFNPKSWCYLSYMERCSNIEA